MKRVVEKANKYDIELQDTLLFLMGITNYYDIFSSSKLSREEAQDFKLLLCSRDYIPVKCYLFSVVCYPNKVNKIAEDYNLKKEDRDIIEGFRIPLDKKYILPKYKKFCKIESYVTNKILKMISSVVYKKMRFIYKSFNYISKDDIIYSLYLDVMAEFYRKFVILYNDNKLNSILKYMNATITNKSLKYISHYTSKKRCDMDTDNSKVIFSLNSNIKLGEDDIENDNLVMDNLLRNLPYRYKKAIELTLEISKSSFFDKYLSKNKVECNNINTRLTHVLNFMGIDKEHFKSYLKELV